MPTTVADAFSASGLVRQAVVRWGTRPPTGESGVYVVALTDSANTIGPTSPKAPLATEAFESWLRVCPELTLDGARPTVEQLTRRIRGFWLADETILYVGLATSLSSRLGAYYRTPIGARRPHSGGYFLKLLAKLDQLWVHYAPTADPDGAEDEMLGRFCANVSDESKRSLIDPAHPFPFANLEWPPGVRKSHGLRGARERRAQGPARIRTFPRAATVRTISEAVAGAHPTQRVTAADLRAGQIRIPSVGSAPTKTLFPRAKSEIELNLRGRLVRGSWDPRMGPDRERSGVLRIGPALRSLVQENDVLAVAMVEGEFIAIM